MPEPRTRGSNAANLSTAAKGVSGKSRAENRRKRSAHSANETRSAVQKGPRGLKLAANRYEQLLAYLTRCEQSFGDSFGSDLRQCASDAELDRLRQQFPHAPADYVEYLRVVGWGALLRGRYTIYERLVSATERLGEAFSRRLDQRVLCFGDNLAGDVGGFLPEQRWELIEISHLRGEIEPTGVSFAEFIGDRVGLVS